MKPTSKQAKRDALDLEFEKGKMHITQYKERLEAIRREPDVEPVAPVAPDVFVSMAAMKETLMAVAANIAPLLPRIQALEKKLDMLESQPTLTQAVADLNAILNRPLQAIYDSTGRVVGAQRVHRLDS